VAKVRERISVNKQARQNTDLEIFDLKTDDVEVWEKYQVRNLKEICRFREFRLEF
jgi:hypothetical protein